MPAIVLMNPEDAPIFFKEQLTNEEEKVKAYWKRRATVCEHEYFVKPPEESDDDSDDDTSVTLDDLPLFKKAEIDFLRRQRQAKSVTVDESESSPTSQDEDVETLSTTNSDADDGTISMTEQDEEKIQNTRGKSIEYPHPYLD
ncbi:unnamed protein product [Rotaria sp. Silwood1]|nr:unnamed protein product [Rotaria sp. Silwood1]